jgi:lambda repressor-like predicted transcriptional regulator
MTTSDLGPGSTCAPIQENDGAGQPESMYPHCAKSAGRGYMRPGRGWQSEVARALGVARQKVCDVLAGRRTSARIAQAICSATGIPASQRWPGRYKRLEFLEKINRHAAQGMRP